MDWSKSYKFASVESQEITYEEYVISGALDRIAELEGWSRAEVNAKLQYSYGGIPAIAVCDWLRNHFA